MENLRRSLVRLSTLSANEGSLPMKICSYVIVRDYGFAPNPFYGVCTLATCKPIIRKCASIGDWVVGIGSKTLNLGGKIIYVMKVDETLTFEQYWADPRFKQKRPTMHGSLMQAYGDNIYHRDSSGSPWCQELSHHSYPDGQINQNNLQSDTQANRVLIGKEFIYWGAEPVDSPEEFRDNICAGGHGHRNKFEHSVVEAFVRWIHSHGEWGCRNEPRDFSLTPGKVRGGTRGGSRGEVRRRQRL